MTSQAKQDKTIYRGQTARFVLSVEDENGDPFNLDTHTLHLFVKAKTSDADPPLLSLSTGTGITHRAQTGTDVGLADVVISSAQSLTFVSDANVFDVWLEKAGGEKSPVVPVSVLTVKAPVSVP